jgi:hypothetical protein
MLETVIVIFGLLVFEIVSSIDNAIVNAHVLKTIPEQYRRLFVLWGFLFGVVGVRGLLPFTIVWLANTQLSLFQAIHLTLSDPDLMAKSVEQSKALLLVGGGMYLVMVFLAWLFLEEKKYAFLVEHFIHRQSVWFYAVSMGLITAVTYFAITRGHHPLMPLATQVGVTAFFVAEGFRRNAEQAEESLHGPNLSALSKLLYLEVLDASFSIDGVVGAFAFTMNVILILIGNGVGAIVVRAGTVLGTDFVQKFAYLKNGAMYSIGMLGGLMVLEAFGKEMPFWFAPMNTSMLLVLFLWLSYREMKD